MTRCRFRNVSICRLEIDQSNLDVEEKDKNKFLYGFHSFAHGLTADNCWNSFGYKCLGESRYQIGAMQNLFIYLRPRKMKIHVTNEKQDRMPDLSKPVPDNWEVYEGNMYDFLCVFYPYFARDFTISKRLDWDSDFGDCVVFPKKENGWGSVLNFIKSAGNSTLDTFELATMMKWKAFRIE